MVLLSSRYRGFISHSGLEFPRPDTLDQYLTRRSARTWAHRVTPGSDEPGPFGRRAPRPAAAYPPRLPQDEQPHPPLPGADRGCRGHPGSGADAEPPGLGPARVVRTAPARRRCSRPRSASSSTSPPTRSTCCSDLGVKPGSAAPPNLGPRRNQNRPKTQTLA